MENISHVLFPRIIITDEYDLGGTLAFAAAGPPQEVYRKCAYN